MSSKPVGIDLGTTNSLVARRIQKRTEVVTDVSGFRIVPSVVAFTKTTRSIGAIAKLQYATNPKNTVFGIKRLIGRRFEEEIVKDCIGKWPFKVLQKDESTVIEVEYLNKRETFPPEAISAMVLAKLKENAEKFFEEPVTDAVISVPAAFNDGQRQATRDAGKIAGLNVLRLINEPTAAAIAYGLNNSKTTDGKHVLVYDLGGGTFDVSILKITNKIFDVIASKGDLLLGGDDFDAKIFNIILKKFEDKNRLKIVLDDVKKFRLMRACEQAKINLTHHEKADIDIDNFYNDKDLEETISRTEFNAACEEMFKKTIDLVKEVMTEASLKISQINDLVLVGGSSRIPQIRTMLRDLLAGRELKESINPDEAVVEGAAIQAALLSDTKSCENQEIVVIESINSSLGLNTLGGRMDTIIKRGTKIPAEGTHTYITVKDKQTGANIEVFEGERCMTIDNNPLATFELFGIPPAAPGVEKLDVSFKVDYDLILHVSAVIRSNKKCVKSVIKNAGRMTEMEIQHHLNQAQMQKKKDEEEFDRITAKVNLETRAYTVMATGNKTEISKASNMLEWLELNQDKSKEVYEEKLQEIE